MSAERCHRVSFKDLLTFNPARVIHAYMTCADIAQTYLQYVQRPEVQAETDK